MDSDSPRRKTPAISRLSLSKAASTSSVLRNQYAGKLINNQYLLADIIGKGANGRVYRSIDLSSGYVVVIKETEKKGMSKEQIDLVTREREVLQGLSHPNIIRTYDYYEGPTAWYLVLEFVEGGSLHDLMSKLGGSFTEALIKMYLQYLLLALDYIHRNGIVHLDVKGANVLATRDGRCKLADFGSCCYFETNKKRRFSMLGTPFWAAPELISGVETGGKADIWSVGCTVIELKTSRPPYWSYGPTVAMYKMSEEPHPPTPSGISDGLSSFLKKCFVKDVDGRSSASELLIDGWITSPTSEELYLPVFPPELEKSSLKESPPPEGLASPNIEKDKLPSLERSNLRVSKSATNLSRPRLEVKTEPKPPGTGSATKPRLPAKKTASDPTPLPPPPPSSSSLSPSPSPLTTPRDSPRDSPTPRNSPRDSPREFSSESPREFSHDSGSPSSKITTKPSQSSNGTKTPSSIVNGPSSSKASPPSPKPTLKQTPKKTPTPAQSKTRVVAKSSKGTPKKTEKSEKMAEDTPQPQSPREGQLTNKEDEKAPDKKKEREKEKERRSPQKNTEKREKKEGQTHTLRETTHDQEDPLLILTPHNSPNFLTQSNNLPMSSTVKPFIPRLQRSSTIVCPANYQPVEEVQNTNIQRRRETFSQAHQQASTPDFGSTLSLWKNRSQLKPPPSLSNSQPQPRFTRSRSNSFRTDEDSFS